jgi:DNA-binding transcriptional regulator YdaS (Cro superfamily)
MDRTKKLLKDAVEMAGSQSKLAEAIGLSQQGVSYILNRPGPVSAEIAVAIHRFSHGKISKSALRPDIFGDAA